MGWGNCGNDSEGRPIGYIFQAICDHPNCDKKIDRGLSYVCGQMHGSDEYSCEKYFCSDHKRNMLLMDDGRYTCICDECAEEHISGGDWVEDEDEGMLIRATDSND